MRRIQVQVAYVGGGRREYLVGDGEIGSRRKESHIQCLVKVGVTGGQSLWGTTGGVELSFPTEAQGSQGIYPPSPHPPLLRAASVAFTLEPAAPGARNQVAGGEPQECATAVFGVCVRECWRDPDGALTALRQ